MLTFLGKEVYRAMMDRFLFKLFKLPLIGKKIKIYVAECEGGMQESNTLRDFTRINYKVDIGLYLYGGCFSPEFNLGGEVTIGRYCSFASNIRYLGANHPMSYVSTSPYFFNKSFGKNVKDVKRNHLYVGNDVWVVEPIGMVLSVSVVYYFMLDYAILRWIFMVVFLVIVAYKEKNQIIGIVNGLVRRGR